MFVVCGESLFDVFVSEGSDSVNANMMLSARAGGSPFNVAIGLRRLGQPVAFLGGISSDFLGKRLMSILEEEKVSIHLVSRKNAPTTLGFVEKDAQGIPSYLFYGEGAADRSLSLDDIATDDSHISGVHIGSFSIVVPSIADTVFELARRNAGRRLVSLDPNVRLMVEPDVYQWRKRIEQLIPFVDIVKVSDEDLGLLYPGEDPEKIIAGWLTAGVKLAALTYGSKGAALWSAQAYCSIAAQSVVVSDTVGAGDTFQAALLDSVLSLQAMYIDWEQSLNRDVLEKIGNYAVQAAAITCSREGADLPYRSEIPDQHLLSLDASMSKGAV